MWSQEKATERRPSLKEVRATKFVPNRTTHFFIRAKDYRWTIQEIQQISGTPVNLEMGLHYIKNTRNVKKANMIVKEDGLVVCLKKTSNGKMMIAEMPYVSG